MKVLSVFCQFKLTFGCRKTVMLVCQRLGAISSLCCVQLFFLPPELLRGGEGERKVML